MAEFLRDWAAHLPKSLGKVRKDVSLKNKVWFRVGGAAEVFYRPQGEHELSLFLKSLPQEVPVTIIGMGSNLLVREGGIPGVTIQLGAIFGKIEKKEDVIISGAAVLDRTLSLYAASEGIQGFEFLIGVPGALGGAIRMNAGAYGQETQDLVESIKGVTRSGEIYSLTPKEIGFSYRCAQLPEGFIVTQIVFKAQRGQKEHILEKMEYIKNQRLETQPVHMRTGGSTFKNPPGHKAWQLIDAAGCRGRRYGGAVVSPLHCNFLINEGHATAEDLETLGEEVRQAVYDHSGTHLEWEIQRVGEYRHGRK